MKIRTVLAAAAMGAAFAMSACTAAPAEQSAASPTASTKASAAASASSAAPSVSAVDVEPSGEEMSADPASTVSIAQYDTLNSTRTLEELSYGVNDTWMSSDVTVGGVRSIGYVAPLDSLGGRFIVRAVPVDESHAEASGDRAALAEQLLRTISSPDIDDIEHEELDPKPQGASLAWSWSFEKNDKEVRGVLLQGPRFTYAVFHTGGGTFERLWPQIVESLVIAA